MTLKIRGWFLMAALLVGAVIPAGAHVLNMTRVSLTVTAGRVLNTQVDIDLSLMLGGHPGYQALLMMPVAEQAPRMAELGRKVLGEIGLRLDDQPLEMAPDRWTLPDTPPEKIGDQMVAAMTVFYYHGTLPATAAQLSVNPGSMAKIEYPLAYTFSVPERGTQLTRWLELPGAVSRMLRLPDIAPPPAPRIASAEAPKPDVASVGVNAPVVAPTAATSPTVAPASDASEFTPGELAIARFVSTTWVHLRLGFRHIFPQGVDHILFVLGLFFLGARWRPLLSQTTAFTIAHTTTLGLSSYGIFSLPVRVVEPLIALSIAYVAIENIFRPKLGPTRIVIVFVFGLLHGLGFASSLSEVPLPRDQFFTALLAFNFGVDFGQIAVIAVAFLAVGWFRDKPWYRQCIVIPACSVIGAIGLYWTFTRIFFTS